MKRHLIQSPFLYFLLFMLCNLQLMGQNDTIVLKNKDKLVGEIKQMEKGVLTVETDYSEDDFTITWVEVGEILSSQSYLITLSDGRRISGTIHTIDDHFGKVLIKGDGEEFEADISDIVFLKAVKSSFKSRLTASLSVGFNYTKSNNLSQFTVRSTISYTTFRWLLTGSYNSVRSNQDNVSETHRTDANVTYKYFMNKNRYYELTSAWLSNDEQLLKLRTTIRSGLGQYFIRNNKLYLGAGVGLAWNNEQFIPEANQSVQNSMEAYGAVVFNMFDVKDFSLNTSLAVYPSLTEGSRIRCDYTLDLKYDLPLDFFIKLGLTYNYDSKPVAGASTSDYIFQTTFGWEFN
ncbi:DUF481 domain-containing protein [Mangrovimonas sp. CR14]|uniref:DUF481 domain-containing protein n=1 Tax=Mangrovimonas sp. CR14 TaxID=2706120 RepID=UPI00142455BA|nr:DUF481 domain-containing protein [Mangrovimonas sp. CR14]NIK92443.1 DUF481 domain-containing protein [Mangrovimonas sp. CR14]